MENFLRKMLEQRKFVSNTTLVRFLPRRIGLGYKINTEEHSGNIIRKIKKEIIKKKKNETKRISNEEENIEEENSDELDKIKYIDSIRKK